MKVNQNIISTSHFKFCLKLKQRLEHICEYNVIPIDVLRLLAYVKTFLKKKTLKNKMIGSLHSTFNSNFIHLLFNLSNTENFLKNNVL